MIHHKKKNLSTEIRMFGVSGLTSVSTVRRLGAFLSPVEKIKRKQHR